MKRIYLYLTNSCNLRCRYCYQAHDDRGSLLERPVLIRGLSGIECEQVILFGGEPTLVDADYYVEVLRHVRYERCARLCTNGVLLTEEMFRDLHSRIRNLEVQVSIHSPGQLGRGVIRHPDVFYHYTVSAGNVGDLAEVVVRCHDLEVPIWIGCDRYLARDVSRDLEVELDTIRAAVGLDVEYLGIAFMFLKNTPGKGCESAFGDGLLVDCRDGTVHRCSNLMHEGEAPLSSLDDLGKARIGPYGKLKRCFDACDVFTCRACDCDIFGPAETGNVCRYYRTVHEYFKRRDEYAVFFAPREPAAARG